jgi:hypothetical protein
MNTFAPKRAEENPEATSKCPPRWAESLLRHVLKPRDRESILGDLLEEYREERLSHLGRTCANLWYIRQVFGIAFSQAFKGDPMKRSLICLSFLTLAASAWFGIMETALHDETVLYHPGSDIRIVWAMILAAASLTTIFYLAFPGGRHGRIAVSGGAVMMLGCVIEAIFLVTGSARFEGHFLLYGTALILQLVLVILTVAYIPDVPEVPDTRLQL